ncbi:hypothetical protein [Enterococcus sp. DIV0996a]|uniref:hypothetical protein n=1 Tax=Enterococcus sp. DIV0996a TaxID=2774790 RepID=UPI003F26C341
MNNVTEIEVKHYAFCKEYLLPNILKIISQIEDKNLREQVTQIFGEQNFKQLICSQPVNIKLADKIDRLIGKVEGEYNFLTPKGYPSKKGNQIKRGKFKEVIRQIFLSAYELFSNKDDTTRYESEKYGIYKWNSYEYVQRCGIYVCPYCNSEFIYTQLENKNSNIRKIGNIKLPRITIRPQLDHFIAKEKKPLLAVSIFNLVPSCKTCNTSIKHAIELDNENFMNPLYEDIYSYISFSNINSPREDHYSNMTGRSKYFDLNIVKKNKNFEDELFIKAKNTVDIFRIKERYEPYTEYIQYIISRELLYTKLYSNSIENAYPNLFSKGEIEKIKVTEHLNYNDFIFSKIVQDLLYN